MAFWKKTKKEEESVSGARPGDAAGAVRLAPEEPKEVKKDASASFAQARKITGVLNGSHLTEKTTAAGEKGVYVFRVRAGANKIMVRKAVEQEYGVGVTAVRMINTKEKARVRGRIVGWKPGFKKAMVALKEGQKIEIQ